MHTGKYFIIFLAVALSSISTITARGKDNCKEATEKLAKHEKAITEILSSDETHKDVKMALKSYLDYPPNSAVRTLFPEKELAGVLEDPAMVIYGKNLEQILHYLEKKEKRPTQENLFSAIRHTLHLRVPEKTIDKRLDALAEGKKGAVLRALGDNTLEEMHQLLYGNNIKKPSSDSLLGKYLEETKAKTQFNSFDNGETRLMVPLSEKTFPAFKKYFGREELLSIVGHALIMQDGTVKGIRFEDLRVPHEGMVLPLLVLKTTEGQRATQYFELFKKLSGAGWNWNHVAAQPWLLNGYSAEGGYHCCTHWIGNIPIGDKLVDSYSFPGNWEAGEKKARTKHLKKYEHEDPLVKRVWTVPGHEQLADAIGLRRSNLRGDFAATNLVAETLLVKASDKRVPIVFQVVTDVKKEMPEDYNTAQ